MRSSRYVLARTATALAATSQRLVPAAVGGAARKQRRKRNSTGKKGRASREEGGGEKSAVKHADIDSRADVTATDVDEVERLLAATSTRSSGPSSPVPTFTPSIRSTGGTTTNDVAAAAAAPAAAELPSTLDPSSVLHFQAVHQAANAAATTAHSGPTHVQQEQIERRRSKLSLAEAEFDVGVTERLVPELARLPALHEVHYGDAVVREVDRSHYFAQQQEQQQQQARESTVKTSDGYKGGADEEQRSESADAVSMKKANTAGPLSNVVEAPTTVEIDGTTYVEVSLDNDLNETDFAAFDAEASQNAVATAAAAAVPGSASAATTSDAEVAESSTAVVSADDADDTEGDAVASPLTFGTARPWFVPPSGVVQLEPLTPTDCALLLRFLLHLRQQTEADLVPTLRRALQQAEAQQHNRHAGDNEKMEKNSSSGSSSQKNSRRVLTLADVIRYLDTASPPVIGFTESLPSPSSSSAAMADTATSPAFVFHLYLENVSSQNAIGHLATFFGIPQRCFQTHSAVSKMSCTTVLCAVAENRLRREHLLLLNTLRHPGFVLRVSNIQEVDPGRYAPPLQQQQQEGEDAIAAGARPAITASATSVSQQLFGELARWQPLYEVETLLRRVCRSDTSRDGGASTRQQLQQRLRAVQTLGAVCFCVNREASLARAATDILHGFFKSALLNALQRRKAPMPLQRFLKRPNVATAQHAHHVSTDPTVRQVLKSFVLTNGDWHATVARTPYVWRRRWINALRGLVWNTMASQRLRKGGRDVCVGDVVLKPAFRQDVHRRGIMTVKAEHVMVVTTPEEAAAASLEDVFLPFLRGRYPEHLFAAEETNHPIMTRTNMLALLRSMHAPQLLLGLTEELRLLLDVRAESSPLLFRRLLVKPVEMEYAILEDKPPMRAMHYDAARLLTNDRWIAAGAAPSSSSAPAKNTEAALSPQQQPNQKARELSSSSATASAASHEGACHLMPPSEVLERTTLGARLTSGVLAEDFFSVPSPEDYVVLGHAHRRLSGDLVAAAPHSNTADVGDRVYTVYVRAVVEHNLAGLSNILREYFLLSGIETESDSALQHKVHRMRRELDPDTPLLTAPVYCTTCFNRDHDTQEQCAEYQYKVSRRAVHHDVAAAVVTAAGAAAELPLAKGAAMLESAEEERCRAQATEDIKGRRQLGVNGTASTSRERSCTTASTPMTQTVCMRWHLRRRNEEQRWGVHLTKALHLVGIENAQLIREGAIWNAKGEGGSAANAAATSLPDAAESAPWPTSWITGTYSSSTSHDGTDEHGVSSTTAACADARNSSSSSSRGLMRFLQSVFSPPVRSAAGAAAAAAAESLQDVLMQSPVLLLPSDPVVLQLPSQDEKVSQATATATATAASARAIVKTCAWTLRLVNTTPVATQRDVAAALLQPQAAKSRDVWLTFETQVRIDQEGTTAHTPPLLSPDEAAGSDMSAALSDALQHSTHAAGQIPQSTAALPPGRRHEVELAMRAAVHRTSPATQRWLQDLPYRLTLVLVKHRRHLHRRRSWGLQLDGVDMTLVNFARLMVQYMYISASADKRLQAEHAVVVSLAPAASFPRNDQDITARLFEEVLPRLEPLLNDMYRVVRINNTPVHHKAEAARAMAEFQVALDAKLAKTTTCRSTIEEEEEEAKVGSGETSSGASDQFFLTLTLERKGSSYRLCAASSAEEVGESAATANDTRKQQEQGRAAKEGEETPMPDAARLCGGSGGGEAGAAPSNALLPVETALLEGLVTPQCPVRPLTPMQLTRSAVTLAINRLLLTEQTRDKWGLRLQPGTRRLKAVQQNRQFSFHVFAAKQSQGTRIADTLRLVSTSRPVAMGHHTPVTTTVGANDDADAEAVRGSNTTAATATTTTFSGTGEASNAVIAAAHVITRSFYLYYVERVNQKSVRHHAELRQELFAAAQPSHVNAAPAASSPPPPLMAVASLPPESVTLSVRQYPLLRFTATVRRGGVGEGSALGPVGLQVDRNMRILSVFADSPMARALDEAVGPLCSARRLIKDRNSAALTTDEGDGGSHGEEGSCATAWEVVALPRLRAFVAQTESVLLRTVSTSSGGQSRVSQQHNNKPPQRRQWAYELDEDVAAADAAVSSPSLRSTQQNAEMSNRTLVGKQEEAQHQQQGEVGDALRALAEAAAHTLQQLGRCSMVDGVHVLQTSLLQEYAVAQLAALTRDTETGGGAEARVLADLSALKSKLEAVYAQVRWEVVYAARSHRPLRTPADLAAAFAPGVAEETISIQQFVED